MYEVDFHKYLVKEALEQLSISIKFAKRNHFKIISLIVGYGSSSKSHKIKTSFLTILDEMVLKKEIKEISDSKIIFNILNGNNYRIQTCTAIYRLATYYTILPQLKKINGLFLMGDTPLWVNLLQCGTIHYIDSPTSVYRIGNDTASHPKSLKSILRFNLSCAEMRVYFSHLCNYEEQNLFAKQFIKEYIKYKPFNRDYTPVVNIHLNAISKFILDSKVILSIYKYYLRVVYTLRIIKHKLFDKFQK